MHDIMNHVDRLQPINIYDITYPCVRTVLPESPELVDRKDPLLEVHATEHPCKGRAYIPRHHQLDGSMHKAHDGLC